MGRNRPPRPLKDWHTRKQLGTLGGCTYPARVLGAFLPSCVALSARGGFVCRSCIPCASCEGSPSPTFKKWYFWRLGVLYLHTKAEKQTAKEGGTNILTNKFKYLSIMSQLTKSAKAQKSNIKSIARGFNFLGLACIEAARVAELQKFFEGAGVPDSDASNTEKKAWLRDNVSPRLPQLFNGTKWVAAVLGTNKKNAHRFNEGESDCTKNCGTLEQEFGTATGEMGALRSLYLYEERIKRVPRIKQDLGSAGKIYETDKNGARVFDLVSIRYYVCDRPKGSDGGDLYTLPEIMDAFFLALGIPQAIAAEAAEAAQLKAAKAVAAAEQAAARAKTTADKAKANAKKMAERATEKAKAAKAEQAANGMDSEQAQKIVNEAEARKAAEQAEQAEQASKAKGENVRKKANTKTKASEQVTTK